MKKIIPIGIIVALMVVGGYYYTLSDEATEIDKATEISNQDTLVGIGEAADLDDGGPRFAPVDLTARNYSFNADIIKVHEGDEVTITLASEEGVHDFVLDAFDAATARVAEGERASVTFVADNVGEFQYYSSIGDDRARGMVGTLIVQ